MKSFKIGDLTVKLPIIQGGMGVGISLSGLASAVANEGGVGVISCAGIGLLYPRFSKDYLTNSMMGLREELRKARAKTRGIVGVNVMVALSNFSDMVRTAISEKADIIFSGAGLPLDLPSYLREDSTTKLVPIVSSARAAPRDMRKMEGELRLSARRSGCRGPQGRRPFGLQEGADRQCRLLARAHRSRGRFRGRALRGALRPPDSGDCRQAASIPARISTGSCGSARRACSSAASS